MTSRPLLLVALCYHLSACQASSGTVHALHDLAFLHHAAVERVTDDTDFFRLPYPNNARFDEDSTVDMRALPRLPGILTDYMNLFDDELAAAGVNPTVYFRFDGPVADYKPQADPSTDPVQLIDLSSSFDERVPLIHSISNERGEFIGGNALALRPAPGVTLFSGFTYLVLVTDKLTAANGSAIAAAPELDRLLTATPPSDPTFQEAYSSWAPARKWLTAHPEVRQHLINATVFTTGDFTSSMAHFRAAVRARPTPTVTNLALAQSLNAVDVYEGRFTSPNFQSGEPPYLTLDSAREQGRIKFDATKDPIIVRDENLRVALSVPQGTMPQAGWPLIIYAHGTGGDYKSFVREGLAESLGTTHGENQARFAMISIDQVLHGPRDPQGGDGGNFFNLFNLVATRDNHRQAAADLFSLVQLSQGIMVASAPSTGKPIRFDVDHIYFLGHSQGSITGSLFLSAEPNVRAAGLSGAGGLLIYTLLDKVSPIDIPAVVEGVLREPVSEFHPFLGFVQQFFEVADPVNYAPLLFGFQSLDPKSIFLTWGVGDTYTPRRNNQAFAVASGVTPVLPLLDPLENPALFAPAQSPPIAGNAASGKATAVWVHYAPPSGSDGHFVLFDNPAALPQFFNFLNADFVSNLAQFSVP